MTPGARLQAAIEVLDQIIDGTPAEKALTGWGRRSRYAGSKDRAAVRDHVFTALRCWRSHAALGGGTSGRARILGGLRDEGVDPTTLFNAQGHAPSELTDEERQTQPAVSDAERLDFPDWLWPEFSQNLGDQAEAAATALRSRAPVHLRVNTALTDRHTAQTLLAEEGVETTVHSAASTALEITEGARKLRNSQAYQTGLVELQDAASQAVIELLPLSDGQKVLDYCAGGGGKSLAMAAQAKVELFAHDINITRMKDLPTRASRGQAEIDILQTNEIAGQAPFDLVLCDVPCSGSGSWRRAPEGKWSLTQERLQSIRETQAEILDQVAPLVAAGGTLAYATCSMLTSENMDQVQAFLDRNSGWELAQSRGWQVHEGNDGFFAAVLTRKADG